ncbi:MAG: radical SAM protein [Thermodesulfobacteriota bacterium]
MPRERPSYIRLYESGELSEKVVALRKILKRCTLCPRNCMIDRTRGVKGLCRVGASAMVSSFTPHFGEEPPLTGFAGSGTIFLSYCNLNCIFCQNFDISHLGQGAEVTTGELAEMMISLQRKGCHNINFVTPTHQSAQIVAALPQAAAQGLEIPLVYNSGGYDSPATIKLLEGVFDIYMPDIKYGDNDTAMLLSNSFDYVELSRAALSEMHRQVGDLVINADGIAERGVIVRHLVLPGGMAKTREVMKFVAEEISPDTYVNLMDQYRPCHNAVDNPAHPVLGRCVTPEEFAEAVQITKECGIKRIAEVTV